MSGAGLLDPYLKLRRAKAHLDALDELLKPFAGEKAYTITTYPDPKQGRYIAEVKLLDVPDDISLTVGDLFYNMRSCLDQLVWSLARHPGGMVDPRHTQFPIMSSNSADSRKRFDQQTMGVPDLARGEILALQPYHRGNAHKAHPLWRLDAMCNLDKHRRILANGSEVYCQFARITRRDILGLQPLPGGGVVAQGPLDLRIDTLDDRHIISVPLAQKHKLRLKPDMPFKVNFGIGFGAGDPTSFVEDRDTIGEIYQFIENTVLPRFVRFFP